jgi:sugar phosphate isomerase/epimerase
MFGNPLEDQEMDRQTLQGWKDCIDNAHHFGATCVAGFTGRIRNKPLTDSLPRYKKVWSELAHGTRSNASCSTRITGMCARYRK